MKDSLGKPSADQSFRRNMVEFCVGYTLILAAIWTLNPWQRWFYWIAIAWIVVTTWMQRPTWKALGLGLPGLAPVICGSWCCIHACGPGSLHCGPAALAAPAAWSHAAAVACLGISDLGGYATVFAANLFPAPVDAIAAGEGSAYSGGRRTYSPSLTCPIRC